MQDINNWKKEFGNYPKVLIISCHVSTDVLLSYPLSTQKEILSHDSSVGKASPFNFQNQRSKSIIVVMADP
jgi:hypothetical protein